MKLVIMLLAAFAPVASTAQDGVGKSAWKRFARQGEYSVLMPAEPRPQTYKGGPGSEPDSFLARSSGAYYYVATIPHAGAKQAVEPATRERVFDGLQGIALDLWKKSLKASFIPQRDILLGGHRGREFNVDSPRYAGSVRMYLTAKRLYIVAFFREHDARVDGEMEKFIDSFEIDETH
jgi:hypothetical protein